MPMIKDLFPDNLLATTKLNPAIIPGLAPDGLSGPNEFSGLTLEMVAKSVDTSGNSKEKADQACPTLFANLSSFVMNVNHYISMESAKLTAAEISRPGYQDYLEWQGLVAALALRNVCSVKGLKLSIQTVTLKNTDPVSACILRTMAKDDCFQYAVTYDPFGQPASGVLFYLCQKGTPFALFHPEVGLCPKKQYNHRIFENVLDWYDPQTGWKNLLDQNTPQSLLLEEFYRNRFAWWLKENGMTTAYNKCISTLPGYNVSVHASYTALASAPLLGAAAIDGIAAAANSPKATAIWGKKGSTILTAPMAYSYQGSIYPLPRLYTDKLFLANVGRDSRLICNVANGAMTVDKPLNFTSNGGYAVLDGFRPVAPFTRFGAEILASQCKLLDLKFTPETTQSGLKAVHVETQLRTPNDEVVTISRWYSCDQIRQGSLPYVMVWPCIPLPENAWKEYYATWSPSEYNAQSMLMRSNGENISPINQDLLRIEMNAGESNVINRAAAAGENKWTVWYNSEQFKYAVLSQLKEMGSSENETLGVIFVPYCRSVQLNDPDVTLVNKSIELAVDFGTTSTVVGFRVAGGAKQPLKYCDFSCTLTVEDEGAKQKVMQHRWLGTDKAIDTKIFTVAQLFDRADGTRGPDEDISSTAGKNRYYVDGRMFVVSGSLLQAYTNGRSGDNVFGSQKIINDMKFSAQTNPVNMHAAAVFLAGIYQYAVLYLLSKKFLPVDGIPYIQLRASYPNNVTLGALKQSWNYANQILSQTLETPYLAPSDPNNIIYYTEAEATTAYNSTPGIAVTFPHMISVDIGGGTTDIALKNLRKMLMIGSSDARHLSIRYAGREIMVESIVECYRRFAGEDGPETIKTAKHDAFRSLWSEGMEQLVGQFHVICEQNNGQDVPRQALVQDASLRMVVECLLAGGMNIGDPTFVPEHKMLRQVITLKFAVLMLTVADVIAQNLDIWNDKNGELFAPDNILSLDMVVSGTSAQMLQYIFNCSLTELDGKDALTASLPQVKNGIQLINFFIAAAIGKERLGDRQISFKFHVNPDVVQKREVCYGLLTMAQTKSNPSTDSTPLDSTLENPFKNPFTSLFEKEERDISESKGENAGPAVQSKPPVDSAQQEARDRANRREAAKRAIMSMSYSELMKFINDPLSAFMNYYNKNVVQYSVNASTTPIQKDGRPVENLPQMLNEITAGEYASIQMNVADHYVAYMAETEQAPYLKSLVKLYLINEMLNRQISKYQQ